MVHVADENWEMWWNGISYKHPPRSAGIGNKLIPPKIESDLRQFATHGSTHFGDENSDFLHDRLCTDLLWDQATLLLQLRLLSSDSPDQDAEDGLGDDVRDRVTDLLISRCNCPFNPCALDDVDEGVSQP